MGGQEDTGEGRTERGWADRLEGSEERGERRVKKMKDSWGSSGGTKREGREGERGTRGRGLSWAPGPGTGQLGQTTDGGAASIQPHRVPSVPGPLRPFSVHTGLVTSQAARRRAEAGGRGGEGGGCSPPAPPHPGPVSDPLSPWDGTAILEGQRSASRSGHQATSALHTPKHPGHTHVRATCSPRLVCECPCPPARGFTQWKREALALTAQLARLL